MQTGTLKFKLLSLCLLAMAAAASGTRAAPPSGTAYYTDAQNQYVQDKTSDGITNLNNVLCIANAMRLADRVNLGDYIALVDKTKCDKTSMASASNSSSDSSSGATTTANYMNAIVNVSRVSGSPMIGKAWMSTSDGQGRGVDVNMYLSATQSPTEVPPYGVFRLDYIGKLSSSGATVFNGYIDSQSGQLNFFERSAGNKGSSDTALALTATSTSAGAGTMSISGGDASNFNFAYNGSYFRRSDGIADQCFDRASTNVNRSVWRYGTYNNATGLRADVAHPGFPIKGTYSGADYMGFAGYYGINFQGVDLNVLADAQPIAGLTIADQRPSNTTAYNLNKLGGKLTKWTKSAKTLDDMDGIPFNFGGNFTQVYAPNTPPAALNIFGNWVMVWSKANSSFTVTGTQDCSGSNGCVVAALDPTISLDSTKVFLNQGIMGFSNSFGGNLNIPPTGSAHVGADAVNIYTQSAVLPGDTALASKNLYCLSQCPTTGSIGTDSPATGFKGLPKKMDGTGNSPFGNNTGQQFSFATSSANTVSYTFDAGGLQHTKSGVKTSMVLSSSSYFPAGTTMFPNGIMTGRLFDTAFSACAAKPGMSSSYLCEPGNPDYYYTWQTGPNQWTQSMWLTLKSDGSLVALDPPSIITYTVPTGTAYGSYAGKNIQLQFNGFGNLFGIPGNCVNPVDNSAVDCKTANVRYVPSFSLPDGATMDLSTTPATTLVVKALDAEVRLKGLGASAAQCTGLTLSSLTVPAAAQLRDPSATGNASFTGGKPTMAATATPKVIDGVIQQ